MKKSLLDADNMIIYICKECGWTGLTLEHVSNHIKEEWHYDFETEKI